MMMIIQSTGCVPSSSVLVGTILCPTSPNVTCQVFLHSLCAYVIRIVHIYGHVIFRASSVNTRAPAIVAILFTFVQLCSGSVPDSIGPLSLFD